MSACSMPNFSRAALHTAREGGRAAGGGGREGEGMRRSAYHSWRVVHLPHPLGVYVVEVSECFVRFTGW